MFSESMTSNYICYHICHCSIVLMFFCVCVFLYQFVFLQSTLCVLGRCRVSAPEIHPVTLHVSLASPRWRQSSALLHISESWHMPWCPLTSSLFYPCLTLSDFLAIVTLSLCHSPSLSIFTSSFLPDYISGDFDSITAEVKAFFSDKVSRTRFAHTQNYRCAHRNTHTNKKQ